jgi:hypothetical protein
MTWKNCQILAEFININVDWFLKGGGNDWCALGAAIDANNKEMAKYVHKLVPMLLKRLIFFTVGRKNKLKVLSLTSLFTMV